MTAIRGAALRVLSVWPLAALAAIVVVAVALGTQGDIALDTVVLTATINLILVIGLYSFIGLSGVFSFGHMAFMAVGAYVAALLVIPPTTKETLLSEAPKIVQTVHLPTLPAILVGAAAAVLLAVVLSGPLMRLSGISSALAMFAVLNVVIVVAENWESVTDGTRGLASVPVNTTQSSALAWSLIFLVVVYVFQRSRFGLMLKASREDEVAARASGINVALVRGYAFVLSAFIIGVGGALYGQSVGSFTPSAFFLSITFLTIVMLVVGGRNSLAGAVVGTLVISVLSELLRRAEQDGVDFGVFKIPGRPGVGDLVLMALILLLLIVRPAGITGGRELDELVRDWRSRARRFRPRGGNTALVKSPRQKEEAR